MAGAHTAAQVVRNTKQADLHKTYIAVRVLSQLYMYPKNDKMVRRWAYDETNSQHIQAP